jgi:hypothetical protein
MVASADDPLWTRWLAIQAEARGLGLHADDLALPLARTQMVSIGVGLANRIKERKAQLAKEDAERAAGAAEHEKAQVESALEESSSDTLVKSVRHSRYQELAALIEVLSQAGADTSDFVVQLPVDRGRIEALIAQAQIEIDARLTEAEGEQP